MSDQTAAVAGPAYYDMTDAAFESALRTIVRVSTSEGEVQRRVRDELGYPYTLAITSLMPTDTAGREARAIVIGLGGLTLRNGAIGHGNGPRPQRCHHAALRRRQIVLNPPYRPCGDPWRVFSQEFI